MILVPAMKMKTWSEPIHEMLDDEELLSKSVPRYAWKTPEFHSLVVIRTERQN